MRLPVVPAAMAIALLLGGAAPAVLSPSQIVRQAPVSAWRPLDPDNLLVMVLGDGRQIVIELAPTFAPIHVANIRAFARGGWWDGAGIVRVQDNYVVQWAGTHKDRALPAGVVANPAAEYDRPSSGLVMRRLASPDAYAPAVGFVDGWPAGSDGTRTWLAHCYGMVGVGRDMPPDTGNGSELYGVIAQAPRQLDRNIALVGRVVGGMPTLSSLPRGTGNEGFYADPAQQVPIRSVRVASDIPLPGRPRYQAMREDSPAFAAYLDARANRRDPFYVRPAGGVDLCNAPVPTRVAP